VAWEDVAEAGPRLNGRSYHTPLRGPDSANPERQPGAPTRSANPECQPGVPTRSANPGANTPVLLAARLDGWDGRLTP